MSSMMKKAISILSVLMLAAIFSSPVFADQVPCPSWDPYCLDNG
jgi:hypothetical protein